MTAVSFLGSLLCGSCKSCRFWCDCVLLPPGKEQQEMFYNGFFCSIQHFEFIYLSSEARRNILMSRQQDDQTGTGLVALKKIKSVFSHKNWKFSPGASPRVSDSWCKSHNNRVII